MAYRTRAEARGIHLPFTTVKEAIEFGRAKVEEEQQLKMAQQQLMMAQQNMVQQNPQGGFNTIQDLSNEEELDFSRLLEEYENVTERDLEQADQTNEKEAPKDKDDELTNLDKDKGDDFDYDVDDDLDVTNDMNQEFGNDKKKRSNKKSKTATKTKTKTSTTKKKPSLKSRHTIKATADKQMDKKDSVRKDLQNKANRSSTVSAQSYSKQPTQTAPNSFAEKIDNVKLTMKVDTVIKSAAMITHQTGRSTSFKIGDDTLKFEKNGSNTYALKNGQKVPLTEAQDMMKQFLKTNGEQRFANLSHLVNAATQNPGIKTLQQSKTEKSQSTPDVDKKDISTKTVTINSR